MKLCPISTPKPRRAAALLALICACTQAPAADRYWSPGCVATFWNQACWTAQWNLGPLGAPPTASDTAILRHVGDNHLLVQYRGDSLPLASLQLDALGTGALTLYQTRDRLEVAQVAVGIDGRALYLAEGGSLLVSGEALFGRNKGTVGRLEVEGSAALQFGSLVLGGSGRGEAVQRGGSVVAQALQLGRGDAAQANYRLEGGSLQVAGAVGSAGNSRFEWEGGTLDLRGAISWGEASFADLSGHSVAFTQAANQAVKVASLTLAGQGTAGYTQTGGTLAATQRLVLATGSSGEGSFTLAGGRTQAAEVVVGARGTGTVTVRGGQFKADALLLGQNTGSTGSLVLSGGVTELPGGVLGGAGFSELRWDAGATLRTPRIEGLSRLAFTGPANSTLPFEIGTGPTIATHHTTVGGGLTLRQTGGVHDIAGSLVLGETAVPYLTTYHLQGGTLRVDSIVHPHTASQLILDGGVFEHGNSISVSRLDIAKSPSTDMGLRLDTDQSLRAYSIYLGSSAGGGRARVVQAGGRVESGDSFGSDLTLYGDSQYTLHGGSAMLSYVNMIGPAAELRQTGGRIDVTSSMNLLGGRYTLAGLGFLEADAGVQVVDGGALLVEGGGVTVKGTLTLGAGSVTVSGGRLTLRTGLDNGAGAGVLYWQGGALEVPHQHLAVDELHLSAGLTLARTWTQSLQVGGLLANGGTLQLDGSAFIGQLQHHGLLRSDSGWLRVGSLQTDGRIELQQLARLDVSGDADLRAGTRFVLTALAQATFAGRLTLDPAVSWQGGSLSIDGQVDLAGTAPATFALDGNLIAGDTAQWRIDLGTAAADAWQVSGRLRLGGVLQLVAGEGFAPTAGAVYPLFTAGTLEAGNWQLDTHAAPLPEGLRWDASQLALNGSLRVAAVPEPASALLLALGLAALPVLRRRRPR